MVFTSGFDLILGCLGDRKGCRKAPRQLQKGCLLQGGSLASFWYDFWTVFGAPDPHESMRIVYYRALCTFEVKLEKRPEKCPEMTSKSIQHRRDGVPRSASMRYRKLHANFIDFYAIWGSPTEPKIESKIIVNFNAKKKRKKQKYARVGVMRRASGGGGGTLRIGS